MHNLCFAVGLWLLACCVFSDDSDAISGSDSKVFQSTVDSGEVPIAELDTLYSDITPSYTTLPQFGTASVTVINASQFQASDVSVSDVVERAPGVQMQQSGETGSYSSLSVRGAPSQQTQIYIDGMLQPNVGGEGGSLQHILLGDVERVEIYRSNSPNQFAQGSPGGAINVVRRTGSQNQSRFLAEIGSFDQYRLANYNHWRKNSLAVNTQLESLNVENDFPYLWDNSTQHNPEDDSWQARNNAEYESLAGSIGANLNGDNSQYEMSITGNQNKKYLPHVHNIDEIDSYYEQTDLSFVLGAHKNQWLTFADTSLRYNYQLNSGHFYNPNGQVGTSVNDSTDELISNQLQHTSNLNSSIGLFTLNNSVHFDEYSITDSIAGSRFDAHRTQWINSLGNELFIGDAITTTANIRLHLLEDKNDTTASKSELVDGNIGLRIDSGQHTLQLNGQSSHRVPNLLERFGTKGVFVGNEELLDETALSADVSYSFLNDISASTVTGYYRDSENSIAAVYNSQGIGRYINLDNAVFYGVEWQADLTLGKLSIQSSGTLQRGLATSNQLAFDLKQPPGFYPISISQGIGWQFTPDIKTDVSYQYEYGLYYDRTNSTLADTKHLIDASLNWKQKDLLLSFSVENIFNQYYQDFSRKYLPGRKYTLTLEYQIGDNS